MNLYSETIDRLKKNGYGIADIEAVCGDDFAIPIENFLEVAKKTNYDNGYGGQEVATDLIIKMKDGSWFERGEYDGSEWWAYKKSPEIPQQSCRVKYLTGETSWETLRECQIREGEREHE